MKYREKSVLYACACLMKSQLSTRRFHKINCDIRTFVSKEREKTAIMES
ncbi:hypothetical protein BIFCAT_01559 [Bifidobacterium catenulatum DSM 16992 = JCM 1194 = LMG 11043]|uniref:Uncharacterized protein n=1 Tax=Bifidobacterium catenulatum DSM 16992 = JCM 1194 = LMG 11043 TaxID=566552 RepID=B6XWY0_9BIFI|nr:hypothetical protein BIFCAT_01559 [Bifidobacterium catenulatum DSM 16992 = JCM 1194 = LMG 11043]